MDGIFQRSEMVFGKENMERLKSSHVAVFGVGGVGGNVCEALVRGAIGELTCVDNDFVDVSNINRQLVATSDSIGEKKVEAVMKRLLSINPELKINPVCSFFNEENKDEFDFSSFDYVVDAIDTVSSKLELILCCKDADVPVISSMGAGNKLHPELFEIADIYKTSVCPLARVMRRELKARGVDSLKVVYSKEQPSGICVRKSESGKSVPGSTSFVPPAVGLIIAGAVIRDICNID